MGYVLTKQRLCTNTGKKVGKKEKRITALSSVAQFLRWHSAKQKVTGSLPGPGTCLGCRFDPVPTN